MQAYIVENSSPALHGDTLEHGEHCKEDVVELSDAIVRPNPRAITVVFLRTPAYAAGKLHFGGVHCLVIWWQYKPTQRKKKKKTSHNTKMENFLHGKFWKMENFQLYLQSALILIHYYII